MIDLRQLQQKKEIIRQNIENRYMHVSVDEVIALQTQRSVLIQEVDKLRKQRNDNAQKMKSNMDNEERKLLIAEGKSLKLQIAQKEKSLNSVEQAYLAEAKRIPNYAHKDAPVGKEDKENLEIKQWGTVPTFSFKPKDHVQIGQDLDLIDFDTAAKVSGSKFYYLKNDAVLLELALERYALDILKKHGFTLTITPDIAKEEILEGIGFNPRGAESNIYALEGTGTCLVGTAEITLGGYYADTILSLDQLPIRLAGLSHCFRKEAGAAGKYSKGLYRVHQFSKVEMFVYAVPEESDRVHRQLLAIEEEIFQGLGIPYRVVDTCTGDLGAPAYRKFDIEAWMPGRGSTGAWGEVTSTSNCTDYQARRLKIRYKDENNTIKYVHLINGTAIAVSRAIVAILENFQQEDGSVVIPKILRGYIGLDTITQEKG